MQTTLLGLAVALILALLAALVGPHFVDWNDHRAFFEAEASRLVGMPVKVGGDIDAGILPFPTVTLNGIAIGPAGEASKLRARSLRIELGLGPLMRGELRATEMKLVGPQLSLGLDSQGQIDWPPLALATETLSIDRLSIEDGRATLTDAGSRTRLVLDQLRFAGDVRSLTGPVRGKGEFVSGGGLYGYEISAGRSGPEGTRLKLSLRTDERPLTVEAEGLLAFERVAPRFEGVLTLGRPAGAVLASGKAAAYEPWRLTSKVKAGVASATLEEVSFQYGPDERAVTLGGAADFKFGAVPQMQAALTARQLDLDRLLATPDAPRRLPLASVQAFGEVLSSALRPSWPVKLTLGIDTMTVGGATVQAVASELRSDGAAWVVDRLEFRAPGFTHVKVDGRLYPVGAGLGFAGGAAVDSNDPRNLLAWLSGRPASAGQIKPWHTIGDVTFGADRIAVERLRTAFDGGAVEGNVAYTWPAGNRPARLAADLRAADLDLDGALSLGGSALSGLGLERPGEASLAVEIGHARIAGLDARNIAARFTFDAEGFAIDRLSVGDFADASLVATGRIRTLSAPGGSIAVNLDARDLGGIIAAVDKAQPPLAEALRRLTARQKTAALRATVSLDNGGSDSTVGKVELTGQIGAVSVNVAASATGKREAFSVTDLGALSGTDVRIDGRLGADDDGPLLALLGLDRMAAAQPRPARLAVSVNGPANRDLRFEGKFESGALDAGGSGTIKLSSGQPATVELEKFSGAIGGSKMQGRLALRLGEMAQIDGAIDAESLDVPALVAAAIGMPAQQRDARGAGGGWSTEPFAWSSSGLTGRIELKAQRATLAPALVAAPLRGVVRFSRSEVVFEELAGELAKGRLEARLAISNGSDGVTGRLRVGLTGGDLGALLAGAERPSMSGRVAVAVELEGAGRSPAALMGSLAGFGTVTLEQAKLAGLNPDVFGTVTRAVELGIPVDGNRIRDFVQGVLDNAGLPVSKASAAISINAGQARLSDIAIQAAGADIQATASIDLTDATLDARLTLNGMPAAPGAARPAVLVALKGALTAPKRTVDTSQLTNWLTLRAVEQQARQLDAIERAGREMATPPSTTPVERPAAQPMSVITRETAPTAPEIRTPSGAQAPALPPPIDIPATPRPRVAPRADGAADRAVVPSPSPRPPALVGAQN